ncbi:MAG: proline--tRNA ligase [Pseudomonadota bacterium]
MKRSHSFLTTLRETPAEAKIVSHRLMLRAGMIHQTSAGIYSWLPLGLRVLKKIEQIVREEQDKAGAQEVILPLVQPADLWRESGRYDAYGKEMLRFCDRHERDMLYGPTAEEVITDVFRHAVTSYKQLPQLLYQIHWKFRDEIRPRFGVMRGREFLMKDTYSFDISQEAARLSYQLMFRTYLKTFARLDLTSVPVKAPTGPIGGDLSHEFQVLAETGESEIFYDVQLEQLRQDPAEVDIDKLIQIYAAADELHDPKTCPVPEDQLKTARGIEVGHIFYFGTKYAEPMNAHVSNQDGERVPVHMGSYGIGVSRLVAAIIEAHHDAKGIIWPESVAPYKVGLVNVRTGDQPCDALCDQIYQSLSNAGVEVLYDDRPERAGVKFADMDLIGLPWQIIVGPRGAPQRQVELKNRLTGEVVTEGVASAIERMIA